MGLEGEEGLAQQSWRLGELLLRNSRELRSYSTEEWRLLMSVCLQYGHPLGPGTEVSASRDLPVGRESG